MGEVSSNGPRRRERGSRVRPTGPALPLVLAALCVIAFVVAVTMVVLFLHSRSEAGSERASRAVSLEDRQRYVDTATTVVTHLMTIRQETLQQDVDRINGEIEGDFAQQFTPRKDSFEEIVKTTKVVADGDIVASGVEKDFGDHADVLMAVDQNITNPSTKKPQKRNYRMRITVNQHPDGTMKVAGVNFVP